MLSLNPREYMGPLCALINKIAICPRADEAAPDLHHTAKTGLCVEGCVSVGTHG